MRYRIYAVDTPMRCTINIAVVMYLVPGTWWGGGGGWWAEDICCRRAASRFQLRFCANDVPQTCQLPVTRRKKRSSRASFRMTTGVHGSRVPRWFERVLSLKLYFGKVSYCCTPLLCTPLRLFGMISIDSPSPVPIPPLPARLRPSD